MKNIYNMNKIVGSTNFPQNRKLDTILWNG